LPRGALYESVGARIGTAGALGAIEVVDVARGQISPVYLLDAAVEAALVARLATSQKSR
jgi:hypothetical protein